MDIDIDIGLYIYIYIYVDKCEYTCVCTWVDGLVGGQITTGGGGPSKAVVSGAGVTLEQFLLLHTKLQQATGQVTPEP